MQEKNLYDIQKLLKFVHLINDTLGGEGVVDYIAITPDEFSLYIQNGISMILIDEINKFQDIFSPNTVFFNENHPQLIIANTDLKNTVISNKDVQYFIDFVNSVAEFICPCTGSEIHIQGREIRIYIDQVNLLHNEYIGVYNLLNNDNLIYKIVFNTRPYISLLYKGDVYDG